MKAKSKWKNRHIKNLTLKNAIYSIDIVVKEGFLDAAEDYRLFIINRKTFQKISLPFHKAIDQNFIILKVMMDINEFENELVEDGIWDVYIERTIDGEVIEHRIKSNNEFLEFFYLNEDENKKMFYPYTTKGGNLSFQLTDYKIVSNIEQVSVTNDGILNLEIKFDYPDKEHVKNTALIVQKGDKEFSIPFEVTKEQDYYLGKGKLDVNKHYNPNEKVFFKFYLECNHIRSNRLRWLQPMGAKTFSMKKKWNGETYRLLWKPTEKSKYLSFQVGRYYFWKEQKQNIKTSWVQFRRGRTVQRAYKTAFYFAGKILPVSKKLVIFESFSGKQYSDNPRAIYEYMKENYPDYKLYWSADRRNIGKFNPSLKVVRRFSIKWLWLMVRAKYWITNSRLPLWIPKPNHTTYVQTWHGTPLKRLAADMEEVHMPGTNTEKYKRNFLREASKWDYLVSPNRYSTEIFKRAFDFQKTVIESGYPRNDVLFKRNNEESIRKLKKQLGIPLDKKVILYAPTWRDNQFYRKGKYKFELQFDLDEMQKELGDDYIVIMRMHYLVAENLDLEPYAGFAYDFSYHGDIGDLYLVADLLITDYSSVFFDYANLRRPMIFFVYDIEDYRDNLRGFYFNFEEKAPGLLVKTTNEIIEEIKRLEAINFSLSEQFEEFYNKFCYLEDGFASKRVVETILGEEKK